MSHSAGGGEVATKLYRQALEAMPQFHPTLSSMVSQSGDWDLAIDLLSKAIQLAPTVGIYHRDLCALLRKSGRLNEALAIGRRALKLLPEDAQAHYVFAMVLADKNKVGDAVLNYSRALELDPKHDLAWNNMGAMLEQIGEISSAEFAYYMAITVNPKNSAAMNNLGVLCAKQGKLSISQECFENAIKVKQDYLAAHFNISTLKTYNLKDPHLLELEKLSLGREQLLITERIQLNFALGKAREDIGDFDGAFAAYAEGNHLHYEIYPYDEELAGKLHSKVIDTFGQQFFSDRPSVSKGRPSKQTPIFIVGMPRSGTTLVEQILSSHPSVFGAGEIMDLSEVIETAPKRRKSHQFTDWCQYASEGVYSELGRAYEERLFALASDQTYITDKMLGNYHYIGMIHKMLPDAKIVHVMRDPMGSCFSCFSRHFENSMNFAYDLDVLGRYYLRYIEMMQHWHQVLPVQTILDIRYEDVVEDVEGQIRQILEFVGLPWDASCLEFHQNKRYVRTASMAQVSQPIYKTSLDRWEHFARHLGSLTEIVKNSRQ